MNKIGKYEILEKIGVGGFGEVFKGRDPFIKRHVAIKTCTSGDQDTRNRFFQEAEIAGKLSHRNITTVYDFGVENSFPYLVQEYLSGEDLDRKIKRRDYLPYAEKLHYLIQIARGLAYAHQHGVIHRDVKPANIRVLEDGTVKIMDFGIAKLAQQETGLTKTGMTVGTAAYLPPEQIRGEPVDHRTDVFSFGVLAYELLAFERPFQGEQISAVIFQILNREPRPLRDSWPTAPQEVIELIARCLAKDPRERFGDGAAVLRFLETVQEKGRDRASGEVAQSPPVAGDGTWATAPPAHAAPPTHAPPPGDGTWAPAPPAHAAPPAQQTVTPSAAYYAQQPQQQQPQQPPPQAPAPQPSAPSSGAMLLEPAPSTGTMATEPRRRTIDDLELTSVSLEEPSLSRTMPVQGTVAVKASKPSPLRYVLLVLLPILALGAGWGLGDQKRRGQFLSLVGLGQPASKVDPEITSEDVPPPASGDTNQGSTASGGKTQAPPPPPPPPPEPVTTTTPGGHADTSGATTGPVTPPPPPSLPPPPKEPEPGRVVVANVDWSETLTVRVGRGRRYPLTRVRSFPLSPGTYNMVFELDEPDYQAQETVQVRVLENQNTNIESPILQPGALSVRAGLGKPQGRVTLGEQDLGSTPISRRKSAPGQYQIRIVPLSGDGAGIEQSVVLHPGQETVLTFDLDAGKVSDRVKPLKSP